MSATQSCCCPCPDPLTVNVPGIEGDPGADGTNGVDGVNAYTITTGSDNLPAVSGTVQIDVATTAWMVVGQILFVENWGFVQVDSIDSSTQVTVENLGYTVNAAPGTPCGTGAGVSPGGSQPDITGLAASGANSDIIELTGLTTPLSEAQGGTGRTAPVTPLPVYATGAALNLTVAFAAVIVGGTTVELTLTTPGTWLLLPTVRFSNALAESTVGTTFTAKLRRTNNTAADVTNATADFTRASPGVGTPVSVTVADVSLPAIIYKTANSDDLIQMQAKVSAVPDAAGNWTAADGSLVAVWLNSEES